MVVTESYYSLKNYRLKKKKQSCVQTCPPQGHQFICSGYLSSYFQQHTDPWVQGVNLHRHMCLMRNTWPNRPHWSNTQDPPTSSHITSRFPTGFRPLSLQVRALSYLYKSRQVLIEDSNNWKKWRSSSHWQMSALIYAEKMMMSDIHESVLYITGNREIAAFIRIISFVSDY